ncbi:MAG: UDP-N-acetylmuramoyl-tripeptide--D-alanyl-D-alanine ligase [Glaciecola sp.]|jgi:UDP-N-acetylmuramoyl-tripeptide--D-alanyl-D-alanine ligase
MTIAQLHDVFLKSSGVCTDTRNIQNNSIFFALKGGNFNGNQYALNALSAGCIFAVVDEDIGNHEGLIQVNDTLLTLQELANFHRSKLSCPVMAIAGSNGKTTTKELLASVLRQKYTLCATKGNLNNQIGVPLTILSAKIDVKFLLIEMGANHQKEIEFLCHIAEPDYGLLANIGLAHLEGFGGLEGVKKGKTELYKYLNSSSKKVFFNNDEPSIAEFKSTIKNIVPYGADTNVKLVKKENKEGLLFLELELDESIYRVQSQLFGNYNVNNILTALAVGNYFEVDTLKMVDAIKNYKPTNNRSEIVLTKKGNDVILDAYNANPTSMHNAIKEFSTLYNEGVYILGDMLELGEQSETQHELIIQYLKRLSGKKILVGNEFGKHKAKFSSDIDFLFFTDVKSVTLQLSVMNIVNTKVLIKGSRGVALEKTMHEL